MQELLGMWRTFRVGYSKQQLLLDVYYRSAVRVYRVGQIKPGQLTFACNKRTHFDRYKLHKATSDVMPILS